MQKRKRKKNNINIYFLGLVLAVLGICLYLIVQMNSKIKMQVIHIDIVDLGEIQKTIEKDVVVIRKNTPIISKRDGVLTKFYAQGDRVPKGVAICKIQESKESENEIATLTKINMRIEDIQKGVDSYSKDIENMRIQNDINSLYSEIQDNIRVEHYKSVYNLKAELLTLLNKKNIVNDESQYDNADISTLLSKKKELENKLSSDNIYLRASQSGIVSYYVDGLEDKFSFDNMYKLNAKNIASVSNNVKEIGEISVKKDELIGYIVDNHYYYFATEITKQDVESIRRDVKLSIIADDITFNAYFYDFFKDDDGKFIGLFKIESEDYDFLKKRKGHVIIVYDYAKGILVPNNAITEVNGKKGVYIVNEVGIAKFVSLGDVLLADDLNSVIRFSYDDFNEPSKLSLYDEIILSPVGIKDGQKVR